MRHYVIPDAVALAAVKAYEDGDGEWPIDALVKQGYSKTLAAGTLHSMFRRNLIVRPGYNYVKWPTLTAEGQRALREA